MLAAAAEGSSGLGPALVTAGGVVLVAIIGLIGILATRNRRDTSGDSEQLIVTLASSLSDERDARLAAERERDALRGQLDACIDRERRRHRP